MSSVLQGLTAQRDAVLAEHIAAECAHDIERALKTFRIPHNYVFPLSLEAPGAEAVSGLLAAVFAAFPDFEFLSGTNPSRGRFSNRGTHLGEWTAIPGSGNRGGCSRVRHLLLRRRRIDQRIRVLRPGHDARSDQRRRGLRLGDRRAARASSRTSQRFDSAAFGEGR